jgi:ElaA protein
MAADTIHWDFKTFEQLSSGELYDILTLRNLVFVVEQTCIYLDTDGRDLMAGHLTGRDEQGNLVAYCRLFAPGLVYQEASIGRVVAHPAVRYRGLGKQLMQESIRQILFLYGDADIRISAQLYLKRFYEGFGFEAFGEKYLEDDIDHIAMIRKI